MGEPRTELDGVARQSVGMRGALENRPAEEVLSAVDLEVLARIYPQWSLVFGVIDGAVRKQYRRRLDDLTPSAREDDGRLSAL